MKWFYQWEPPRNRDLRLVHDIPIPEQIRFVALHLVYLYTYNNRVRTKESSQSERLERKLQKCYPGVIPVHTYFPYRNLRMSQGVRVMLVIKRRAYHIALSSSLLSRPFLLVYVQAIIRNPRAQPICYDFHIRLSSPSQVFVLWIEFPCNSRCIFMIRVSTPFVVV